MQVRHFLFYLRIGIETSVWRRLWTPRWGLEVDAIGSLVKCGVGGLLMTWVIMTLLVAIGIMQSYIDERYER